jgi:hypothetical protein
MFLRAQPRDIARMVNIQNWERFQRSFYYVALQTMSLRLLDEKKPKNWAKNARTLPMARTGENPLKTLLRFEQRYRRIPAREITRLNLMLEMCSPHLRESVTERGLALGLEVLPECSSYSRGRFPENLLPLHWENLARSLVNETSVPYSLSNMIALLEKTETDR